MLNQFYLETMVKIKRTGGILKEQNGTYDFPTPSAET